MLKVVTCALIATLLVFLGASADAAFVLEKDRPVTIVLANSPIPAKQPGQWHSPWQSLWLMS